MALKVDDMDRTASPDFIDRQKIKIPTILTLRDIIFLAVAVGTLVLSWAQYGERMSIIEEQLVTIHDQNTKVLSEYKDLFSTFNNISMRLTIAETEFKRTREDVKDIKLEVDKGENLRSNIITSMSQVQQELIRLQTRTETILQRNDRYSRGGVGVGE